MVGIMLLAFLVDGGWWMVDSGKGASPSTTHHPPPTTEADILRQAEEAFTEGVQQRDDPGRARPLFRRSAELFEELRQRGAANPTLFRDQGNACLLADDLPGAILAYRRGLRLEPNDRTLQQLLAAAREQVIYPPQSSSFARPLAESRPPWLPRLTVRNGLLIASAVYALAWVVLLGWLIRRRSVGRSLSIVLFTVGAFLFANLTIDEIRERNLDAQPLVVIARDDALLRKGNGEAYPRRYEPPLNRGVEARLLFERGDWVQIALSGGETGWVPRGSVLIDQS